MDTLYYYLKRHDCYVFRQLLVGFLQLADALQTSNELISSTPLSWRVANPLPRLSSLPHSHRRSSLYFRSGSTQNIVQDCIYWEILSVKYSILYYYTCMRKLCVAIT